MYVSALLYCYKVLIDMHYKLPESVILFLYNIQVKLTLYFKPLCIMHYTSSFNALIMPCNAPYNAL